MASKDTFRREFKPVTTSTRERMDTIKVKGEELLAAIRSGYEGQKADREAAQKKPGKVDPAEIPGEPDARCLAVVQTNLETAIMWAVKGLTE